MTSSSFQSWWVLFTCRILLRRTLWRISAAGCTSLSLNRITSRWNENALRTAHKMKRSGRDSLGHPAAAAWASTKVSLKIQLLVAFHNIVTHPRPCPLSFIYRDIVVRPSQRLACVTFLFDMYKVRSEWAIGACRIIFKTTSKAEPVSLNPFAPVFIHLLNPSQDCFDPGQSRYPPLLLHSLYF